MSPWQNDTNSTGNSYKEDIIYDIFFFDRTSLYGYNNIKKNKFKVSTHFDFCFKF